MFVVLFEVQPREERFDEYLSLAGRLRPELERVEGFILNVRWRSLRRPGWLLSVSTWQDEKALIRWRTHAGHHAVQGRGRSDVFRDYRLRVGEAVEEGRAARQDLTEADAAKLVSVTEAALPGGPPEAVAAALGLADPAPAGRTDWDVFEAILTPGRCLLLQSWRDGHGPAGTPPGASMQTVRVIRAYGLRERAEAPQYFPPVPDRETAT